MKTLLALLLATAGAAAQDASVRITNSGRQAINELYVASAALNAWGADRLGDKTLAAGANHTVALPPGQCVNDIRVIYADGSFKERRRVNTCSEGDVVFP